MSLRAIGVAAALTAFATLSGCGSVMTEQFGHSMLVTPGKYSYYNCIQAQRLDDGMAIRQKEYEELMERAAKGQGGSMIGNAVYRSPYNQILGERAELRRLMVEKRCSIESPRTSDRQVF